MTISDNALSYVGQREKPGNSGFKDPEFEKEMKEEGWQYGWAWCAVFAKVVFKNVYPEKASELDKRFSPSAVQTFHNFKNAGYPIYSQPVLDSLVVWQNYKKGIAQWSGHVGIVVDVLDQNIFRSVEGNANSAGGREGVEVAVIKRNALSKPDTGLRLLGFVKIS